MSYDVYNRFHDKEGELLHIRRCYGKLSDEYLLELHQFLLKVDNPMLNLCRIKTVEVLPLIEGILRSRHI